MLRAAGILVHQRRTPAPVSEHKDTADIGARRVHLPFHELAQVLTLNEPVVDVLKVIHQLQHRGFVLNKAHVFEWRWLGGYGHIEA